MKNKLTPFGVLVKNRLWEIGMTQKELAKKVGVSPTYLTDILYGNRSGSKYREKIQKVLKLKRSKRVS